MPEKKSIFSTLLFLAFAFVQGSAETEPAKPAAYVQRGLASQRVIVARGAYFPRLTILDHGILLATFRTNAGHVGKQGRACGARSTDGGVTWSSPVVIFDRPDADDAILAHAQLRDGTVLYGAVSTSWKGEKFSYEGFRADAYILRSTDYGLNWSPPALITTAPFTWAYPFGRILELPNGELLMTLYGGYLPKSPVDPADDPENNDPKDALTAAIRVRAASRPEAQRGDFSFLLRSKDGGKTWGDLSVIARGYNETCAVQLPNGRLMAVMRSVKGAHLAATFSDDGGRQWTVPRPITCDYEIPGDLLVLKTGEILLTFGERLKPYGVQALLSYDSGVTWDQDNRYVLAWDGDHSDLGYPVTIERADGKMVTIYYIVYGWKNRGQSIGPAPEESFVKAVIWDRK